MEEHKSHHVKKETLQLSQRRGKSHSPQQQRRYHYHHYRKKKINFDGISGVRRIQISSLLQKMLNCLVGEHVTLERTWIYVDKEPIQDNLELHEESSEFLPFKELIMAYPREKFLLVYIPDEERAYDEFYICLTEKATDTVDTIIRKQQADQERRLYNSIYKKIKKWFPFGSEDEMFEITRRGNRPLIEVEVESRYPILPFKIELRFRNAEDVKDGYMELRAGDPFLDFIEKRRTDTSIQVTPPTRESEAQTNYPFPRNQSTQYEIMVKAENLLTREQVVNIKKYAEEYLVEWCDKLTVNWHMNLYTDDYLDLMEASPIKFHIASKLAAHEYLTFVDVNLCKNKMISSVCWHPLWTGIVAIAYVDTAPVLNNHKRTTDDVVTKTIHDHPLVLVWSFNDFLSPKLILEAHREVTFLSFCPFDENILIGGCSNGQTIIWDIRNKLDKVEKEEILTSPQQRYRAYMFSLMDWMLSMHNTAVIRPTAISELRYSHTDAIVQIRWLNPYYGITNTGKIEVNEDENSFSCQFFTASEDGYVEIYDLHKKPVITAGGFKPQKQVHRLKERPPALLAEVSPLKIFHLTLKPIFRILIPVSSEQSFPLALSSLRCKRVYMNLEEINPDPKKKRTITDRIKYKGAPKFIPDSRYDKLYIGSMLGDYMCIKFDGLDFDPGETINSETAQILYHSRFHDGPVHSLSSIENINVNLTIGGKTFALWSEDLKDRPVFWRKHKVNYTFGGPGTFYKGVIKVAREDGKIEVWRPYSYSKSYVFSCSVSSNESTGCFGHRIQLDELIVGSADAFGSFRMFTVPPSVFYTSPNDINKFERFIEREVQRKKKFQAWQEKWNKNNETIIAMKLQREAVVKVIDDAKEDKDDKTKPSKARVPYTEFKRLSREKRDRDNINRMITEKKRLNVEELNKQRKPLQILEDEMEKKKRKQRQRIRNSETIFQETVEKLFPEIAKPKQAPPPDPYAGGDADTEKVKCFQRYNDVEEEAKETMILNPFKHVFDLKRLLKIGIGRRSKLEVKASEHRRRHERFMKTRLEVEDGMSRYIPRGATAYTINAERTEKSAYQDDKGVANME